METDSSAPAGIAGQHYFYSNKLGLYRSVAVAATYKVQSPWISPLNLRNVVYQALRGVLEAHPPLSYGLIQQDTQTPPSFIRLEEIKLCEIVQFYNIIVEPEFLTQYGGSSDEKLDSILTEKIGIEHAEIWGLTDLKPTWRCIVLNYGETDSISSEQRDISNCRVDIIFLFHHGLGDGLSSKIFHQSLQLALKNATSQAILSETLDTYIVPNGISRPIPCEKLIKINLDGSTIPQKLSVDTADYWTGSNPTLPTVNAYKSRIRLLSIPATNLSSILKYCRKEKITLTGLLHGLLITSLAYTKPSARGFISCTPYSLRPFFTPNTQHPELKKSNEIGCNVSSMTSTYSSELLNRIRETEKGSAGEKEVVLEIAREFRDSIREELEAVGRGTVSLVSHTAKMLALGHDAYEAFLKGALKRKREDTYELSNIGVFTPLPSGFEGEMERDGGFELKKLVFTQCGMVTGAVIGCSVVSMRGGPLVASFTWMEGAVEGEVVESVVTGVEEALMGV